MKDHKLLTEGDINLGYERQKWNEQLTDEKTRQLLDEDARYFFHQSMSTPCLDVVKACSGSSFITEGGREVLDFHGNSVHQVGFRNEYVIGKIKEQLDILPFTTRRYTNEPAVRLAKKLVSLMPHENYRVLFAPGGTSAVGMALKLARVVTGSHKVVSLWDSFHGASLDAISAGGEAIFRKHMGPAFPGVMRIPPPMTYRGLFGDSDDDQLKYADYLEYVIEKEGDIGAFISETIRNTDVHIPSKKYWKRVREICDKHDVVLILDEIPIGMGRTGKQFAFEHFDIEPDIVCLGKGLGAGIFPLAAMIARDEYNVADEVSIGHYTHEKNPLACIAGYSSIEYIQQEKLLGKVEEDEIYIRQRLTDMKNNYPIIGDVRGLGMLWGIELVRDRRTKERAVEETGKIMYECLKNGVNFKVSKGNVIQLSPALTISRKELDKAFDVIDKAINESC